MSAVQPCSAQTNSITGDSSNLVGTHAVPVAPFYSGQLLSLLGAASIDKAAHQAMYGSVKLAQTSLHTKTKADKQNYPTAAVKLHYTTSPTSQNNIPAKLFIAGPCRVAGCLPSYLGQ